MLLLEWLQVNELHSFAIRCCFLTPYPPDRSKDHTSSARQMLKYAALRQPITKFILSREIVR